MKNIVLASTILLTLLLTNCTPTNQIRTEVRSIMKVTYSHLGIKNDGSLGKSGQGYSIIIRLSSPISVNNTYRAGVNTNNGTVWSKDAITPSVYVALLAGEKWASVADVVVPSEAFDSEMTLIQQNRENQRNQISKLEGQLQEIAYRSLTEARWLDYDKAKADKDAAERITAQIDELNTKINLDDDQLLIPYVRVRLEQVK